MMKNVYLTILLGGLFIGCNSNPNNSASNNPSNLQTASVVPVSTTSSAAAQNDVWLESLITETPQEGRALAIQMARKTVGAIQSDPEVKKRLRGQYAENAELLILSSQVVAIEFQTVAEANNYWRE